MSGDRSQQRAMRAAQRRAARRRQAFEEQVLRPAPQAPAAGVDASPSPAKAPSLAVLTLAALATGVLLASAILLGLPVLGQGLRPLPLVLLTAGACLAGYRVWRLVEVSQPFRKVVALATVAVLPALIALGLATQVVVNGKAYLSNSVTAQSFRLASDMHADLLALEENQRFLELDPSQAAGLNSELRSAREEDLAIAERWNPAITRDVPLPGFLEVMRLVNAASSVQAEAISAYEANIVVRDPARDAEISALSVKSQELYVEAASVLALTVSPLGIEFSEVQEAAP